MPEPLVVTTISQKKTDNLPSWFFKTIFPKLTVKDGCKVHWRDPGRHRIANYSPLGSTAVRGGEIKISFHNPTDYSNVITVSADKIVWAYYKKEWPKYKLIHLDGDRGNIHISNLSKKLPERKIQTRLDPKTNKWDADVKIWINSTSGYKSIRLGRGYDSKDEAEKKGMLRLKTLALLSKRKTSE